MIFLVKIVHHLSGAHHYYWTTTYTCDLDKNKKIESRPG